MTIGGGSLQICLGEAEMNACEQLFGFITAAGEEGSLQCLHQTGRLQLEGQAALHHRQIRVIVGRHAPHLVAAAQAVELHLLSGFLRGERERGITGQSRHDFTEQPSRERDRSTGLDTGSERGLDAEVEIKSGEAEAIGAGIGRQQHIGQNRVRRAGCHSTAHELQSGVEFGLGAHHLHRAAGLFAGYRCPTVSQPRTKRNGWLSPIILRLFCSSSF